MTRGWRTAVVVVAGAALVAGCGGSGTSASSGTEPNGQVQVATSEKARRDGADVSARLKAAGYTVIGSAPAGAPGGFAVTLDGGGVVVVLVLDSSAQANAVAQGFTQAGSSADALVQQVSQHVYAANTPGTAGPAVSKAEFDKLVKAGERH
jgi:hypothetical protein